MEQSFTIDCGPNARVIITDVLIGMPFVDNQGVDLNNVKKTATRAIWDTGATGTVITKRLAAALGLVPIGRTIVHGVNSRDEVNEYLVSVWLPNKFVIPSVRITECNGLNGPDILIGMDIISLGDFSVSKNGNHLIMSFRMPSKETIDYTGRLPKVAKPKVKFEKIAPPTKKNFSRKERREISKKNK